MCLWDGFSAKQQPWNRKIAVEAEQIETQGAWEKCELPVLVTGCVNLVKRRREGPWYGGVHL